MLPVQHLQPPLLSPRLPLDLSHKRVCVRVGSLGSLLGCALGVWDPGRAIPPDPQDSHGVLGGGSGTWCPGASAGKGGSGKRRAFSGPDASSSTLVDKAGWGWPGPRPQAGSPQAPWPHRPPAGPRLSALLRAGLCAPISQARGWRGSLARLSLEPHVTAAALWAPRSRPPINGTDPPAEAELRQQTGSPPCSQAPPPAPAAQDPLPPCSSPDLPGRPLPGTLAQDQDRCTLLAVPFSYAYTSLRVWPEEV